MAIVIPSQLINTSKTQFTLTCIGDNVPDDLFTDWTVYLTNTTSNNVYLIDPPVCEQGNIPEFEVNTYAIVTSLSGIGIDTWNDGVWSMSIQFFSPDQNNTYQMQSYTLSLYEIECQMAKFGAKLACACSDNLVRQGCKILTYYDAINQTFAAGDYNSTNILLKKLQNILTKEGCGCGC